MMILKAIATFILFLISFSLMWLHTYRKMKDWRSSFVVAFLFFGVFAWFLTEMLSFFGALTPSGILCGWILYNAILLMFFIRLYKQGKIQLKMPQVFLFQRRNMEVSCVTAVAEEETLFIKKSEKLIKIVSIFAIVCCCLMLLPQVSNFIIVILEKVIGRNIDHDSLMKTLLKFLFIPIVFFGSVLLFQAFLREKYGFLGEYGILAFILFVTLFIAVTYPPTTWDSMVYHLPRIEYWLQNKNLNHYYTPVERQLLSAPFAEIMILQGRALSGDDYLVNLVQWFSLLGSIIGVSKIASHLGLNRKMQIVTALFFATVPMAILQASSTQTDLVETFCIICMAERFLAWRKTGTLFESLTFGFALGLSILTKGTAYPIAFPFVLCFAVICIKHFRKRFIGGCLAALLCLAINFPHYTRNYMFFGGNPIGAHPDTVSNFSVKSFVITFFLDINSHLAIIPVSRAWLDTEKINNFTDKFWDVLKPDKSVFPYGRPKASDNSIINLNFIEDTAQNTLYMLLIIVSFFLLFSKRRRSLYSLLVICSWCMFAYFIPWQPWITRLQLPLFALSAPVFSLALENKYRFRKLCILLLCSYAILPLVFNSTRPLLPVSMYINNTKTIWNSSREDIGMPSCDYEKNFAEYSDYSYIGACAAIVQAKSKNIGLIISNGHWEYPMWRYLRRHSDQEFLITNVGGGGNTIDSNIDTLLILSRIGTVPNSIQESFDISAPMVLKRNMQNKSEWKIIYGKGQ